MQCVYYMFSPPLLLTQETYCNADLMEKRILRNYLVALLAAQINSPVNMHVKYL